MKLKSINFSRVISVAKKEAIHIVRDKASLAIALVLPFMMLMIFGFAVNSDVKNVEIAIYNSSASSEASELISMIENSSYFKIKEYLYSDSEILESIDSGHVKVGLVIPPDFSRNLDRGENSNIQFIIDGSDPSIARSASAYSSAIVNNFNMKLSKNLNISTIERSSVISNPFVMYNPTLESSKFNIPGVLGLILQNITIMLTSFSMVRERERGTMEQLIMTPITSIELILGKIIPYIFIGFTGLASTLIASKIIFGIEVRGSYIFLVTMGLLFLFSSLALGLLFSTIAKSQLQAMQMSLAFLLPSVLLSGFMFPREAMPRIIYFISSFIPLTYFNLILRGIIMKGVGLRELIQPVLLLITLIIIVITLSIKKFRKTIE